jgi:hypothetical protein
MCRFRLIMFSLFAVFAFSAVASASASAAECPDTVKGGDVALCKGGIEVPEGSTFVVLSKKKAGTESKLEVEGGPTIKCEEANNSGLINATDSSLKIEKLVVRFEKKCEVTNNAETKANCVVSEPIKTKEITGTFVGENPEKIKLAPTTGETFAEVTIKNNGEKVCVFKITAAKITGTQEAKLPKAKMELVEQELKVEPSESNLKFAGKAAKFELTEEFEINTMEAFSFQQS